MSTPDRTQLDRPEKLRDVLKNDKIDDCLSCRIMGSTALIGFGAYSYFSGQHQLKQQEAKILASNARLGMKGRRAGITGIALSLVGLGFYRLVN